MAHALSSASSALNASERRRSSHSNLAAGYHTFLHCDLQATRISTTKRYLGHHHAIYGLADCLCNTHTDRHNRKAAPAQATALQITPAGVDSTGTITLSCSQLPTSLNHLRSSHRDTLSINLLSLPSPCKNRSAPGSSAQALSTPFALLPQCSHDLHDPLRDGGILYPLLGITLICTLSLSVTGFNSGKPSPASTPGTPSWFRPPLLSQPAVPS